MPGLTALVGKRVLIILDSKQQYEHISGEVAHVDNLTNIYLKDASYTIRYGEEEKTIKSDAAVVRGSYVKVILLEGPVS